MKSGVLNGHFKVAELVCVCVCAPLMADSKSTSVATCLVVFGAHMSFLCIVEEVKRFLGGVIRCPS